MKQIFVIITLFLTIICATYFYSKRVDAVHNQIDLLQAALAPIKHIVPVNELIFFSADPFNGTLFPQSQYVLAPHILSNKDSTHNTWTLHVLNKKQQESRILDTAVQAIKWRFSDSLYIYFLTNKKQLPL